jgi:hypothetical protein
MERYWIVKLLQLLNILASSASDQITYLNNLGTSPLADELALELEDMIWVLDKSVQEELISLDFANTVRKIDKIFSAMSETGDKSIWVTSALETSGEWEKVRKLAKDSLKMNKKREEKGSPINKRQ